MPELDPSNLPSKKLRRHLTFALMILLTLSFIFYLLDFNVLLLFTDFHFLLALLGEMFPPNLKILTRPNVGTAILETLAMAFCATIFGIVLAFLLALMAAENTTPHVWLRKLIRTTLAIERVVPTLVIVLIFLISVGLGPFAGTLTLVLSTAGTFGKLFGDTIERVEESPCEAIYLLGATKSQVIYFGIIPQALPSFIANSFYAFDVNLRAAIGLGIFGAGGIGFEIHMAMKVMQYQDAMALILITVVLIIIFEKVSDYFRHQLLQASLK